MSARHSSIGRQFVGRAARGAVAGAVGTAAMDLLLYRRYRRGDGKDSLWQWEFAGGVMGWDEASAPGQLGQKLERFVIRRPPPDRWARMTTNVMHWATGIGWGMQYGALAGRSSRHRVLGVLALGPVVWLSAYVILPLAGVYKPIWKYDARTLGKDLTAHLVYGGATGAVLAAVTLESHDLCKLHLRHRPPTGPGRSNRRHHRRKRGHRARNRSAREGSWS